MLELALELFGRAEEMRIVLRETAHARESVKHSRALEAIDGAELRIAQWKVAIAAQAALIDENVSGTVHRLESKALAFDLDRTEHIFAEVLEMPRNLVETFADDVRRHDRLIAALAQPVADEVSR